MKPEASKLYDHQARWIERTTQSTKGVIVAPGTMLSDEQQTFTKDFIAGLQDINESEPKSLLEVACILLKHIKPYVKEVTLTGSRKIQYEKSPFQPQA